MKSLLFVNTGGIKLKYSLENAKKRGFKIIVAKNTLENWEKNIVDDWIKTDTYNIEQSLSIIGDYLKKNNVDGVLTFSEFDVPLTAYIQQKFGYPRICGGDPFCLRNKYLMRDVLRRNGFHVPRFIKTKKMEEIVDFFRACGGPLVIKPVWGIDSLFVKKISTVDEIEEIWTRFYRKEIKGLPFRYARMTEFQVEEYIAGVEMSIETVTYRGETELITFTDKHPVFEPYFIETGHKYPSTLSEKEKDYIFNQVKKILSVYGIENAVCHTELKWVNGEVYIVEIAARPAGGVIPQLLKEAAKFDLSDPLIDLALGLKPKIELNWECGISSRAILSPSPGWIKNILGINEARSLQGVIAVDLYRNIGDRLPYPPEEFINLGKVIAKGKDAIEADEIAQKAADYIMVEVSESLEGW